MPRQAVFFQGIPGLGKTTVAEALRGMLRAAGHSVAIVSQDNVRGNKKKFVRAFARQLDDPSVRFILVDRNNANPSQYAGLVLQALERGVDTSVVVPQELTVADPWLRNALVDLCVEAVWAREGHPTFGGLSPGRREAVTRNFATMLEAPLPGAYFQSIHTVPYCVAEDEVFLRRRPPHGIALEVLACLTEGKGVDTGLDGGLDVGLHVGLKGEGDAPSVMHSQPLNHHTHLSHPSLYAELHPHTFISVRLSPEDRAALCDLSQRYLPMTAGLKLHTDHITLIHVADLVRAYAAADGTYHALRARWDAYAAMAGRPVAFTVTTLDTDREDVLVFGVELGGGMVAASGVPHITGRLRRCIPPQASVELLRTGTWRGRRFDLERTRVSAPSSMLGHIEVC